MRHPYIRTFALLLLAPLLGFAGFGGNRASRLNYSPAVQSTLQQDMGTQGPASLSGQWDLPRTGHRVEIEPLNSSVRVAINGVEWTLARDGPSMSGSRVLTQDDARKLFPEIGDAPSFLAGKVARLRISPGPNGSSTGVILDVRVPRRNGRAGRAIELISDWLSRPSAPVPGKHPKSSGDSMNAIAPQASGPTVTVKPSLAPNLFGSPSFAAYTSNALSALQTGSASVGNPSTSPTAYAQSSQLGDRSNIASTFNSWLGMANPGTVFGAAFANEVGNRVHFGFHIVGNGTQFELNNIQFHLHGTDPGDSFALDGDFNGANYSSTRVGINYGPDRIKGTPDDVTISSGPGTQLVDELVYVGIGNAIAPPDLACTGTSQAMLDCVKARYDQLIPFSLTATYNVFDNSSNLIASGSGTVNFGSCITMTCPANVVAKASSGQSKVAVTFPDPVATDSCGEPVQVVCVPASGSQFPVGVTTVVCTATDSSGSTTTCSFTVEVGNVVLQDPVTGDCLLFDTVTGDYVFTHCGPGGFTLTGKGSVRTIGGTISLTDSKPDRTVSASFLSNQLTGRATITVRLSTGVFQTFTINSTRPNPSCVCST